MSEIRERIEQEFRNRGLNPDTSWSSKFINDLAALYPEPSREGLRKIIKGAIHPSHEENINRERFCYCGKEYEKWVETIMAWATAPRERGWCEHIRLKWPGKTTQHWDLEYMDNAGLNYMSMSSAFQCCPICAAPRPKEE